MRTIQIYDDEFEYWLTATPKKNSLEFMFFLNLNEYLSPNLCMRKTERKEFH